MGGQIGLTIRQKDGTEHRMERWTNILPSVLYCPGFWQGDESIWDDSIEHWYNEVAKGSKGQTIITSWKMYKHPFLAPSEYGILIIDYQTMTIISAQDYLGVGQVNTFSHGFEEFKNSGMLGKCLSSPHGKTGNFKTYAISQNLWTIFEYADDAEGFKQAKTKIEGLGFELSDKEEKLWAKEIKLRGERE